MGQYSLKQQWQAFWGEALRNNVTIPQKTP